MDASTDSMTIGEVARRAGLQTSAIRYYEELGLITNPPRVNGQRRYSSAILQQLALIQLGQAGGLTLAQIHNLLHGFSNETPASERWQTMARAKLVEIEAQIQEALLMKQVLTNLLDCTCEQLEQCVESID